jgi:hypothetical protein
MDDSFFAHLEKLEVMGFFAGYPLVYAIIYLVAGKPVQRSDFRKRIIATLPYSYALTGTLYVGLVLKNAYPDYSLEQLFTSLQLPFLRAWGILVILFWIPLLAKKPFITLLHSLVFFFLLARDMYFQLMSTSSDKHVIRNDMNVYTDSVLLNFATLATLIILLHLFIYFRRARRQNPDPRL